MATEITVSYTIYHPNGDTSCLTEHFKVAAGESATEFAINQIFAKHNCESVQIDGALVTYMDVIDAIEHGVEPLGADATVDEQLARAVEVLTVQHGEEFQKAAHEAGAYLLASAEGGEVVAPAGRLSSGRVAEIREVFFACGTEGQSDLVKLEKKAWVAGGVAV